MNDKYVAVTKEELTGTRTVYLPLHRSPEVAPQVALVIKREGEGFAVGMAVCSRTDAFEKRVGQTIAFRRLTARNLKHKVAGDRPYLVKVLIDRLESLNSHRPGIFGKNGYTIGDDLTKVVSELEERFQKQEQFEAQTRNSTEL